VSSQFWVGVIVVVLMLELVRIGISTAVLVHVLTSGVFRRPDEADGKASGGRESPALRVRREAALSPTLEAVRGAMDEVAEARPGPGVQRAIDALDDYTRLQSETSH
jgi:hypothetical protein